MSATKATISTKKDINTVALKAVVKDQNDKEMKDAKVVWTSDKEDIATVKDGVVTGVKAGKATIKATADKAEASCEVTVDEAAPQIKNSTISSYKTIDIEMNEEIKAEKLDVTVTNSAKKAVEVKAVIAEDNKTVTISSDTSLKADTYTIVLNGITDNAGNAMDKDTTTTVKKETSYVKEFVADTTEAPAYYENLKVFYTVVDQYGEAMATAPAGDGNEISVSAKISGTEYPLAPSNKAGNGIAQGYVTFAQDSAIAAGKSIDITLTNTNTDAKGVKTVVGQNTITVALVENKGVGTPIAFNGIPTLSVAPSVATEPDALTQESGTTFVLSSNADNNKVVLKASYLDKFGYKVENTGVKAKYIIGNEQIASVDTPLTDKAAEGNIVLSLKNAGTTTITVYMTTDESQYVTIPVTVKPAKLSTITVDTDTLKDAKNGLASLAKVTLSPTTTGLTPSDLKYVVTSGADALDSISFAYGTTETTKGDIYVSVKAKTNAKSNTIKFVVYYGELDTSKKDVTVKDGGVKSDEVAFTSVPDDTLGSITMTAYAENKLTAGQTVAQETTYKVVNKNGEDITATTAVTATSSNDKVAEVESAAAGKLKVKGVGEGSAVITMTVAGQELSLIHISEPTRH